LKALGFEYFLFRPTRDLTAPGRFQQIAAFGGIISGDNVFSAFPVVWFQSQVPKNRRIKRMEFHAGKVADSTKSAEAVELPIATKASEIAEAADLVQLYKTLSEGVTRLSDRRTGVNQIFLTLNTV